MNTWNFKTVLCVGKIITLTIFSAIEFGINTSIAGKAHISVVFKRDIADIVVA